jgi:hypothetical protein
MRRPQVLAMTANRLQRWLYLRSGLLWCQTCKTNTVKLQHKHDAIRAKTYA